MHQLLATVLAASLQPDARGLPWKCTRWPAFPTSSLRSYLNCFVQRGRKLQLPITALVSHEEIGWKYEQVSRRTIASQAYELHLPTVPKSPALALPTSGSAALCFPRPSRTSLHSWCKRATQTRSWPHAAVSLLRSRLSHVMGLLGAR